ncbi:MAG: DEAD/DEAH box helicase [Candidatus Dadabacteria bacterium]|nr:MAG: DEAD/DEAH box helicase [Candidatus Dadabacteria bacterium]
MTDLSYIRDAREALLRGIGTVESSGFEPDPFQKEAISSLCNFQDTLVVAPTGSGKTFIAFEAIDAFLRLKTRAVYTTPLKALSNTKYSELKARFEPEFKVGLLTGDRKIQPDADVIVATTEIYRNELYSLNADYSLVVLDEVHFIADDQRGAVWEESIILTPYESILLMLSASISNPEEISQWTQYVRQKPCKVIVETERPVELRYGFLHPEHGVIPLMDRKGRIFKEVERFYGALPVLSHGTKKSFKLSRKRRKRRRKKR